MTTYMDDNINLNLNNLIFALLGPFNGLENINGIEVYCRDSGVWEGERQ